MWHNPVLFYIKVFRISSRRAKDQRKWTEKDLKGEKLETVVHVFVGLVYCKTLETVVHVFVGLVYCEIPIILFDTRIRKSELGNISKGET